MGLTANSTARQAGRMRPVPALVPGRAGEVPAEGLGPLDCLLMAAWFGLVTGFLELGCLVLKCSVLGPRYYNVSRHFPWMVPASGLLVFGTLGLLLGALARLRPGRVPASAASGLFAFLMALSVLLRWPIYTAACL